MPEWSRGSTTIPTLLRTTSCEKHHEMWSTRGSYRTQRPAHCPATIWCRSWLHRQRTSISSARHAVDRVQRRLSGERLLLHIKSTLIFMLKIRSVYRKISAHEFERGGLLKPIVNTIDGTPTFLSITSENESTLATPNLNGTSSINRTQRLSRSELKQLDEKELIFELVKWISMQCAPITIKPFSAPNVALNFLCFSLFLFEQVKDICNELDVKSLCHKILQNVSILLNADRGSLFLVQGKSSSDGSKKWVAISIIFSSMLRTKCWKESKDEKSLTQVYFELRRARISAFMQFLNVFHFRDLRVIWGRSQHILHLTFSFIFLLEQWKLKLFYPRLRS